MRDNSIGGLVGVEGGINSAEDVTIQFFEEDFISQY